MTTTQHDTITDILDPGELPPLGDDGFPIYDLDRPFQVLSFGGGVQSSALLALCIQGKFERPDAVAFSDTGSEMPHTYAFIEQVVAPACEAAGIEFTTVGSTRAPLNGFYQDRQLLPNIANRQCTIEFKIRPMRRFIRSKIGRKRAAYALSWIGISTDEKRRVVKSDARWVGNRFPLIELGLSRRQCEEINAAHWGESVIVKKSGCWCCPFHSIKGWRKLQSDEPDLFAAAVEMEREMLTARPERERGFLKKGTLNRVKVDATLLDYDPDFMDEMESDNCSGEGGCFL